MHEKKSYRDPARKPLLALSPKGYVGEEDVGDEPVWVGVPVHPVLVPSSFMKIKKYHLEYNEGGP